MSAIPSQLTSLDFFEIKESIRSYLRTRKEFSDYDFEGSSASYLIDILAYIIEPCALYIIKQDWEVFLSYLVAFFQANASRREIFI